MRTNFKVLREILIQINVTFLSSLINLDDIVICSELLQALKCCRYHSQKLTQN